LHVVDGHAGSDFRLNILDCNARYRHLNILTISTTVSSQTRMEILVLAHSTVIIQESSTFDSKT
jgi:hypothetical protein